MTDEKRLIDANALTDVIECTNWYHISLQGNLAKGANSQIHTPLFIADDIFEALESAPTVDAVEVVRCKDCEKSREPDAKEKEYLSDGVIVCTSCALTETYNWPVWCDDFCPYGKRKCT